MKKSSYACLAAALVMLAAAPSRASGRPALASYSADHDRIFWFIHVADIHVGSGDEPDENMELMAGEARDLIQPWFTIVTGDMVEDGRQGEWERYRGFVIDAGQGPDTWFDVPGNHDNNLNGDDSSPGFLDHYLTYSISGAADGMVHHHWVLDTAFGRYQVVGLYTDCDADRLISNEELGFALDSLEAEPDARLAFAGGHHPLEGREAADPEDCLALRELMQAQGVSLYMFGHTHVITEAFWPHVYTGYGYLSWLTPTMGKSEPVVSPAGFSLIAVDSDSVSARIFYFRSPLFGADSLDLPMVLVTAPADWAFGGGNRYAYPVSAASPDNPVRALVFTDGPPDIVRFRVEGRGWQTMDHAAGPVWTGTFDGAGLPVGADVILEVEVQDSGESDSHTIVMRAVAAAACQDGVDNDGDGAVDFPEDPGCTGGFDSDESEPFGVGPYVPPDEEPEEVVEPVEPGPDVEPFPDEAADDPAPEASDADAAGEQEQDAGPDLVPDTPGDEGHGGGGCGCIIPPR